MPRPRRRARQVRRGATIHEVAARAGVSTATVSRTFTGENPVRTETRRRVLAAAESLRYRPNRAARSLVTGAGSLLALVVPDLRRPSFARLASAAARRAREAGHSVAIADWSEDRDDERKIATDLALRTDGMLLCASRLTVAESQAVGALTPLVLVGRRIGALPAVTVNEGASVRRAAAYLVDLGHRAIAFVSGPPDPSSAKERDAAIDAIDLVTPVRMTAISATFADGVALAGKAAASGATAVVVFDGELALGLTAALRESGIDVPGEISVIAATDDPAATLTRPALTTIAPPTDDMGAAAMELLLMATRAEEDKALRTVRFVPRLEPRESTGAAPRRSG